MIYKCFRDTERVEVWKCQPPTNRPREEGARDDYASKTRDSEDLERDLRRGILPGWLHRITDDRLPPTFGRYRQASSNLPKTPFIQYISIRGRQLYFYFGARSWEQDDTHSRNWCHRSLFIQLFFCSATNERSERSMGGHSNSCFCQNNETQEHISKNGNSKNYMNEVMSDYMHIQSTEGAINEIELDILFGHFGWFCNIFLFC